MQRGYNCYSFTMQLYHIFLLLMFNYTKSESNVTNMQMVNVKYLFEERFKERIEIPNWEPFLNDFLNQSRFVNKSELEFQTCVHACLRYDYLVYRIENGNFEINIFVYFMQQCVFSSQCTCVFVILLSVHILTL